MASRLIGPRKSTLGIMVCKPTYIGFQLPMSLAVARVLRGSMLPARTAEIVPYTPFESISNSRVDELFALERTFIWGT